MSIAGCLDLVIRLRGVGNIILSPTILNTTCTDVMVNKSHGRFDRRLHIQVN